MEIINIKENKDTFNEYFVPKKRFRFKEITNYVSKQNELIGEHKYLSDYYNKAGQLDKIKLKLSKQGIMYRLGNYNLNPFLFYGVEMGLSIILAVIMILVCKLKLYYIPVFMIICLSIFTMITYQRNNTDNKSMLMDICMLYTVLNSDISNGVYLNDCLKHMKDSVNSKRLKYALTELILNIKDTNTTVDESLILFTNRFTSKDIQKLSSYIKQLITIGINDEIRDKLNRETSQIVTEQNNENGNQSVFKMKLISNLFILILFIAYGYYIYINIKTGVKIF